MSKCIGCGSKLQTKEKDMPGYTRNIENDLCERCFRIRNYNEYKLVDACNKDFIDILKNINKTNSLVVLVVDLFNISKDLNDYGKYINNDILLVLTKRDILPKSCYDKKIIDYFKHYNLNIKYTLIISSKNNYNYDLLFEKINELKNDKNVYVVGFTNAGKSTMINKIIYNYTGLDTKITTASLPSTTIDSINIKINDELTLIDTPGILNEGDIINYLDVDYIKRIIPKNEIRPITYQIKAPQSIIIENLLRVDIKKTNSLTFYMSNDLNINRVFKETDECKNLNRHILNVESDCDIVVEGLLFIHVIKPCEITIYTLNNVNVYIRRSLM